MLIDAVVLAGGRSTRLSGVPKAQLVYREKTLLQHAVRAAACAGARRIVVVGPDDAGVRGDDVLADVRFAREEPAFGGPAAAIAAGAGALAAASELGNERASDFTLVLACDLPAVAEAVSALGAALPLAEHSDGALLLDGTGRVQSLTALYSSRALSRALKEQRTLGRLDGLAVRTLIGSLRMQTVAAPHGSTSDIDTWADAAAQGIDVPAEYRAPPDNREGNEAMADHDEEDRVLTEWCLRLVDALDAHGLNVDLKAVLGLAGRAAHAVMRPAAPLTTFIVGYAAGLATAHGVEPDTAVEHAISAALRLTASHSSGQPGSD